MPARPHYAQSWEDPRLLRSLWTQHPAEHYHLIASGGDHALDLALHGFRNLKLYDHETAQIQHIEKKINALNASEAKRNKLFGYRQGQSGLLHDGKLERFLALFARRVLPILVPKSTREAMRSAPNTDTQLAIWEGQWQTARWKWVAQRYFAPKWVDLSARHPGLTVENTRKKHPINYLAQFRNSLGTHALNDNPFVEYPLFGQYRASGIPYLDEGLNGIRRHELELRCQSLESALREAKPALRGIHASDILEGQTEAEIRTFLKMVDRACTPGSTLIFWDHRFRTEFPEWWLQTWTPVPNLPPDRVPFYHRVHAFTKS